MKGVRIAALVPLAALVVMVAGGAQSASADTFCSANEAHCSAAHTLTTLEGSTRTGENAVLLSGSFAVGCHSSMKANGFMSLGVNKGVTGSVTALSFTSCIGSCSGATAVNLPYKAEGKASTQAVTVTTGGSGNPEVTLTNCLGLGVSCTFETASAVLHFHGGTPGDLTAEGIPVSRSSGVCPASGSWTAKYVISNSSSAFLVGEP